MELVVTNSLEGTRRKTLHGRKFLVANVTMIVPGVLNGSKGPLLYDAADVEASADSWNHMPIVVYHPKVNGQHVSARRPDVLEKYAVGHVFNTSFSQGKLVGEGWFDEERTKAVDPRVHAALVRRQPMEISTGLFTKNEPVANGATFNGTSYTHVAKDYRPDHLAVLPDQAGACGLKHGCGLMVNEGKVCANCGGEGGKPGPCAAGGKSGGAYETHGKPSDGYMTVSHNGVHVGSVSQKGKTKWAATTASGKSLVSAAANHSLAISALTEHHASTPTGNTENEMTREEMTAELTTNCDCWKGDEDSLDAMPAHKVASLHKSYKSAEANAAVVNTLTEGLTVNGVSVSLEEGGVLHVDASGLTANAAFPGAAKPFTKKGKDDGEDAKDDNSTGKKAAKEAEDEDEDDVGTKSAKKAKKDVEDDEPDEDDKKPAMKTKDKKMTANEWMASAPPEIQGAVRASMQIVEREKKALVKQLTANVSGDKTTWSNRLMLKPIEELREMQQLLPAPVVVNQFVADFSGAGGWNEPTNNEDLETLMPTPTVNFVPVPRGAADKR